MKRKIMALTVTALMLAMMVVSALPALAQPDDPDCSWYLDRYWVRLTGEEWYGYWCYYEDDDDWELYTWWNEEEGYIYL